MNGTRVMAVIDVVPLWCPLSPAIHPDWQDWESATLAWAERFLLDREQIEKGRLQCIAAGELAGRTVSNPAGSEGPQFSADSLMWLFAFDDAYCDEGRYSHDPSAMAILVAEMARIAETGYTASTSACAMALADLRQRLNLLATPVQISRWVQAMRGYLNFQVWEAAHRASGRIPSLDEYCVARIRNGSMELCAMVLDISEGYEVPADELARPDVVALTEMACCIVGLDNDIASYHKEQLRSRDQLNLIDVIAHERGVDLSDAVPEAVAHRDAVLKLYLALTRQVEPELSTNGQRYVDGLSSWIRGNLDWSTHTGRYKRDGQQTVCVAANPAFDAEQFCPPPGIAWWWLQLRASASGFVVPEPGSSPERSLADNALTARRPKAERTHDSRAGSGDRAPRILRSVDRGTVS
jgi:hypothetical protein